MATPIALPPDTTTASGAPRRIGVEIEMSGLDVDGVARVAAAALGLAVTAAGRYERTLTGDDAGDWQVEVDFRLLKQWGRDPRKHAGEDALALIAEPLVPIELVGPPLPLARLEDVERVIRALRDAGAKGTSDSLTNAFGMQLNPELPATDAATVLRYLRAYACLQEWLFRRAHVNLARRATPYVDPLPLAYVRRVIDAAYEPYTALLIDDYLAANPTRNRALDLLPLFAYLDEPRVRAAVDDPLVKARPTLHYRLPNSEIHRADWCFALAWNDWVEVERLAAEPDRLAACCADHAAFLDRPMRRWFGDWARVVEARWLDRGSR